MDEIVPFDVGVRRAHADDVGLSRGDAARDFVGGQPVAAAVVLEGFLSRLRRLAPLVELRRGAEASVGGPRIEERLRVTLMPLEIRPLMDDLLIPVQPEPLEPLENRARAFLGAARLVGVFDAEEEDAAEMTSVEPVEEGGARASDVEISGRGGSEAETGLSD